MTVYSLSNPTRVYPSWASQYVEVGYIRLRWERVGVRGYSLTIDRNPSPGSHLRCDVAEAVLRRSFSRTAAEGGLCLSHKGRGEGALFVNSLSARAIDNDGAELAAFFHREVSLRRLRQRKLRGDVMDAHSRGKPFRDIGLRRSEQWRRQREQHKRA